MSEIITATYQDGAFVPEGEIHLAAGSRVRLVIQPLEQPNAVEAALQEFKSLGQQSPQVKGHHLSREQLHDRG